MNTQHAITQLDSWNPAADDDLPEWVALHMDTCEACRAHFDSRFAAWEAPADDAFVPADLADRVFPDFPTLATAPVPEPIGVPNRRPANNKRWFPVAAAGVASVAALALFTVAGGVGVTSTVLSLSEPPDAAPTNPWQTEDQALREVTLESASGRLSRTSTSTSTLDVGGDAVADLPVEKPNKPTDILLGGKLTELGYLSDADGVVVTTDGSVGHGNSQGTQLQIIRGGKVESTGLGDDGRFQWKDAELGRRNSNEAERARLKGETVRAQAEHQRRNEEASRRSAEESNRRESDRSRLEGQAAAAAQAAAQAAQAAAQAAAPASSAEAQVSTGDGVAVIDAIAVPGSGWVDPNVLLPEAPTGEDYTHYGINPMTLTVDDPLSTFSIDVDTAAYSNSRRMLNQGYLPPAGAVRVEEFVNYFPYDYAQPASGSPFGVEFEAAPSPYHPGHHIVRVGVQGKRVAYDQRKPVHLVFLVDTSGSMQSPDKIGLVKSSLKMLTRELADGDTVSIVAYAGSAGVVLEPTPMSRKAEIMTSLDRLRAGGSTAMGAGIEAAYKLADAKYAPGAVNRVIVLSDGDANVGASRHGQITPLIQRYAKKGITLTTVGFGQGNYKDTMMERLANDGDGNYFYIDSEREARRVFVDQLTSTIEVIAKDVKIQVEWHPGAVTAYRLIGYENRDIADVDFRNDAVDAGEIGSGHRVTALYDVVLSPEATGSIGTVRVRNKAPGPDAPAVERKAMLTTEAVNADFSETSRDYRVAVAAAGFAELLRGSPDMRHVRFGHVEAIAVGAARAEYTEDTELIQLIRRAGQLSGR